MSHRIISFFTFGIVLIIIGGIGKIFEWDQSIILIALGLTFESLALILFTWKKIRGNKK